jgi:hypothetical protein
MEYYVGCGMRGKLDGDGIKKHGRPPVQLSIVLDISGSMGSSFRSGMHALFHVVRPIVCAYVHEVSPSFVRDTGEPKNKLDVAKECVLTLIDNLQPTDAFGLVAFDTVRRPRHHACVAHMRTLS